MSEQPPEAGRAPDSASPEPEGAPDAPPPPDVASDMEQAIAAFDAQEHARATRAKPVYTPFSLRDVDRRIWMALVVIVFFVAVSLGGPPWEASFWITLGIAALISCPFVVGAIFLWQRERS
jgi:hypothetical protein